MPKAGLYRILEHQQTTEFLDRHTVDFRPLRRRTRLQSLAASARQLFRHPCGYCQSMGASVRFKTGVLHNAICNQQMKANPGVLAGCTRLPSRDRVTRPQRRRSIPRRGQGTQSPNFPIDRGNCDVHVCLAGKTSETNRSELWASCESRPSARSTYEGSADAELQAEPVEIASSPSPTTRLSPSTPSNETFRIAGRREAPSPFK